MLVPFLTAAISMGVVYLYGAVGETLIEKGGSLNLGIPGIMCLGALGGVIGANIYGALFGSHIIGIILTLFSIFFAILFSCFGGFLYALFTVTLQSNQNVTGLILTTFSVGFMKLVGSNLDNSRLTEYSKAIRSLFNNYSNLGWFGNIFLSHGFLVYLGFIIAIIVAIVLKKTKVGLFLKSVGESPQTADAQGINVTLYKYVSILCGCAIAGLGGLYYVLDRSGGTTFVEANIEAFGWLAVALVIFSMWRPTVCIIGSIIFGGLYILPSFINVSNIQLKLFEILPYFVTVIVLIITSILNNKNNQPPKSLGINYYREER